LTWVSTHDIVEVMNEHRPTLKEVKLMSPKTRIAPEEETDETEAEATDVVRPSDLAAELEISPKALRAFLRREFPRADGAKNTSWTLSEEMVEKATAHFTASDEDEVEGEDED
jgi:hypothetical protein